MHSRWKVGIAVALTVSCSGSPQRSDKPTVAQRPIGNQAAALAWCDQDYGHVPCAFTAFGGCAEKVGKGRTIIDDDFGPTTCPAGTPPPFMTKQQPVCGRRATETVIAKKSQFTYEASCNQRETTWANVAHEHRTCASDADCVVVPFNAQCDTFPLAKSAATRNEYAQGPCGNPAQGFCAGQLPAAKCVAGCCNLDRAIDRWGTLPVEYPKLALP
ncbi:MAG TPA: hypothetical protein VFV99_03795 [Kofleriaceae bacterium]|nr:hypothetical protein [Kofleriaceae bacterium]